VQTPFPHRPGRAERKAPRSASRAPPVDDTKHVNGGCRSLASDGRRWRCHLGQEAVRQRIIGAGLLVEFAPSPGVG
jgi:hypothetical protein